MAPFYDTARVKVNDKVSRIIRELQKLLIPVIKGDVKKLELCTRGDTRGTSIALKFGAR